ncbi:MAG: hypothetical protein QOH58_3404 [Thermoleophilaceae bacterium]|jgi:hypothetical protein|nr:hypothetical protein [Thermoleophilaceae bacterium]
MVKTAHASAGARTRTPVAAGSGVLAAAARRLRLEPFELIALLALIGVAFAVLVPLLIRGKPLSGAEGIFPPDQLQYYAWIRDAADHGLIGNLYDLAPGERVMLHPGFLLTGLVHSITGLSIPFSYLLLWKPVAIALTFMGCLLYVRRLLPPGNQRAVALALALFSVMPACAVVAWTGWGGNLRSNTFDFIAGEMWATGFLWGYLMTAIAVSLLPLVLLALESWREHRRPRTLWLATGASLLIAWLQPWQGATLLLIVAAVEALRWRRTGERPPAALLAVAVAIALPAIYYFVLSMEDPSWRLAHEENAAGAQPEWSWPWWAMVLTIGPLAAPAALAYRLPARSWQEMAVRIWPIAVLAVFLQPGGTFPYHALQGLALPLAILAVQGVVSVQPRPRTALVVAALAVLILPGLAHKLEIAATNIQRGEYPYFITAGERRALDSLEADPRPGGVLARRYAGYFIPYTTGRETYLGALSWTPDYGVRTAYSEALFANGLTREKARAFVRGSRARFLFVECGSGARLEPVLGPMIEQVRRFGCARVYVLRERPAMLQAVGAR